MSPTDVIVVGGGAIGLGISWRAASRGLSVSLFDPSPGAGASSVAAGMLAPVTEVHYGEESLLALNLRSNDIYEQWVGELEEASGCSTGYYRGGTVVVARDADDNAALGDLFKFQASLGLSVERLTSFEVKQLEPGLAPNVRGGILVGGDHQVDPPSLNAALIEACAHAGVQMIPLGIDRIELERGRIGGVVSTDGARHEAGVVVLAAGAASATIAGLPDDLLPIRPVKGQLIQLRSAQDPLPITRNVRGLDVYLVPRPDGRLVVGATVEERGWDTDATAGGMLDLLRFAYELIPGITEMAFVDVRVGFRPGTPDNAPLLGPTGIDGLIAATGHYRNGMLLTPITAETITDILLGEPVPDIIRPFDPQRFAREAASL